MKDPSSYSLDGSELAKGRCPTQAHLQSMSCHLVLRYDLEGSDAVLTETLPSMSLEIAQTAQMHFRSIY